MPWRPITDDDLRSGITAPEDELFRQRLLADGQTDPYAQVKAQVTSLFRDAIRANPANELDADPTALPEAAIFHAVPVIRHRLSTRFAGEIAEDEGRMEEYKAALKYLREIAMKGAPTVEPPGETAPAKQPVAAPAINQSPRREGWRVQDGI